MDNAAGLATGLIWTTDNTERAEATEMWPVFQCPQRTQWPQCFKGPRAFPDQEIV